MKADIAPKFEKTFPPLEFELKVGYTGFGSVPDLASPVVARYPKEPFSKSHFQICSKVSDLEQQVPAELPKKRPELTRTDD